MIISDVNLIHSQSSRLYVISSEIKKTLINGTISMDLHKIRISGTFATTGEVHADLKSLRLKESATISLSSCYNFCPSNRPGARNGS